MNDNIDASNIRIALEDLFKSQNLAVLATHNHGQPYTSLVAFSGSEDLKALYFVTVKATRKYANLMVDPRAAMTITARAVDFMAPVTTTLFNIRQ